MDDLKLHPLTGEPLVPLGTFKGRPVWPILGAADDDAADDSGSDDEPDDGDGSDDGSDSSDEDSSESDDASDEDSDDDEPDDKPKGKGKGDGERRSKSSGRPDPRESELPAWARDKITNLRSEAAGHRKRAAEFRPKAQDADRYRAALNAGLSERQARRLTGKNYEELLEDAQELRKELGLDKSDDDDGKGKGGSNGGQRRRRDATGGDGRGGSDTLDGKSGEELYKLARSR